MGYSKLDKYILFEVLGRGGMGEVYLAKNPGVDGIGKFLAIKKIRPEFTLDPEMVKMFRREAQVAIKLNHGNIAGIHEFGMAQDSFYLAMEHVGGFGLDEVFKQFQEGKIHLSPEDVLYIILSVTKALFYAHTFVDPESMTPSPVVHRDLSPHNVLLSFEGDVKLIDFGIARMEGTSQLTQPGTVMGKIVYMSPEQILGAPYDHRTDIYSLGIMFWELLSGRRYYGDLSSVVIKERLSSRPPSRPLPETLPYRNEFQDFIDKMLAAKLEDRYSTTEELLADLHLFFNLTYPGYSQINLKKLLHQHFSEYIAEKKQALSKYAKAVNQMDAEETKTEVIGSRRTDTTALVSNQAATNHFDGKNQLDSMPPTVTYRDSGFTESDVSFEIKKMVEGAVNTRLLTITQNQQKGFRKYFKLKFLYLFFAVLFLGNLVFNKNYRTRYMHNLKILDSLYQKFNAGQKDLVVLTDTKRGVVGLSLSKGDPSSLPLDQPSAPEKIEPQITISRIPKTTAKVPKVRNPTAIAETDVETPIEKPIIYRLYIDSEPKGAQIFIDGKKIWKRTPSYVERKEKGPFRLELRKEGYRNLIEMADPSIGSLRLNLKK